MIRALCEAHGPLRQFSSEDGPLMLPIGWFSGQSIWLTLDVRYLPASGPPSVKWG